MPKVVFTRALKRFFPDLEPVEVKATKINLILNEVEQKHPGIKSYLIENNGALREHVNIFIKDELIKDKINLSDEAATDDEIYIMQALSGG